ncbi:enoyl-CoA hydratase [Mycobacterium sp. 852013-50091_SCH5140682]|uniref:crotonase/enoyl-CoA hydratase family protein n=1 Tax=Mycobacterium sp. 852013-50091_SCH5140682 TaxID=1834109 RepID=UPI0007E98E31|nr:crotonase/enoyl-CoA hydratase family protein [Mycobacterium sp. 852013-50091_SCH5140682]OBC15402.1 enoyl-CoA hydratase [Mycobacterium sp. 852013-50091_SCH5140682]
MSAEELVQQQAADGVLTITMNRPAQRNAINHDVAVALGAALDRLDADPAVAVGVLTGAGGTFSAGMDLKAFAGGQTPVLPGRGLGGLTRAVVAKPLIAAVEGWALGGGFELALACDLIVAAENATFGFPEVKRGLIAGEGGAVRLPHRLPHHLAMRLLLTGDPITAPVAQQYGLVADLAATGSALSAAQALAARIAMNAPLALASVKQVVRETQALPEGEAFIRQDEIAAPLLRSDDAREGAVAFAEKRSPVWHGR